MQINPIVMDMDVGAEAPVIQMNISQDVPIIGMGMSTRTDVYVKPTAQYEGDTVFTPSATAQTISTAGLYMNDDLTINPIPSNYGLITWNGSTLTVS